MPRAIRKASTVMYCSVGLYRELLLSAATLIPRRRRRATAPLVRREPATA